MGIELKKTITKEGMTKIREKVVELKEMITRKGTTKTRKRAT